jgi:hypothetical protein
MRPLSPNDDRPSEVTFTPVDDPWLRRIAANAFPTFAMLPLTALNTAPRASS